MIFAFYATGVIVFYYLAITQIKETEYFNGEDDVVIPKHVLEGHTFEARNVDEESRSQTSAGQEELKKSEKVAVQG